MLATHFRSTKNTNKQTRKSAKKSENPRQLKKYDEYDVVLSEKNNRVTFKLNTTF